MPRKTLHLTPPLYGAHHRGRGFIAIRAFHKGAKAKARASGCLLRTEIGQMEDVWVDIQCPTKSALDELAKGLRKTARIAARLQGTKR